MKFFELNFKTPNLPSSWRELTLYSGYRIFLSLVLFYVFYNKLPPEFLGSLSPTIYSISSQFYLLTSLVLFLFSYRRWGDFQSQLLIHLLIDILVLTIIIHVSGGLKTGLGSLLVVVVVAGATLIPGRTALFISAVAAIAVLFEAGYSQIVGDGVTRYSHAGMLGATFFVTALLAQTLSQKILESQKLAQEREEDIKRLALLNEHIISQMQTGIMVIEQTGIVRLSNQSARQLLGVKKYDNLNSLTDWSHTLSNQVRAWQRNEVNPFQPFQQRNDLPLILVSANKLESGEVVLYMENTSAISQQVQQLKLALLGRLTASIAHEIRNPLGAISHAGELLAEVNSDDATTLKLTNIISRHSARMNGIIDTILQMSRRKNVEPTVVVLANWLELFLDELHEYKRLEPDTIKLQVLSPLATVFIDKEQLHQVVYNLVDNALNYSVADSTQPRVKIRLSTNKNQHVIIDVMDNGPGVSNKALKHLFEPFNSERQGGTGLGLYLARELCQANGAWLNYLYDDEVSCFRITIPIRQPENLQ
jgi:two-component system sensor histidine kinase PilS (NtrC family)